MFNLVLKDVLIQKKYILISMLYPLIFSTMIFKGTGDTSSTGFIVLPIMVAYILLMGACGYDDKNKSDIMLNSLPINRIDLVIAKYLSSFVFIFIGISITFVITAALNFSGFLHFDRLMNFQDVLGCTISIVILSSLYFPINFKFGYQKSRYVNMIFFMGVFFLPSILLSKFIKKGSGAAPSFILYLNSQPNWVIVSFILIIAFIIMMLSLIVSTRIYMNKDL